IRRRPAELVSTVRMLGAVLRLAVGALVLALVAVSTGKPTTITPISGLAALAGATRCRRGPPGSQAFRHQHRYHRGPDQDRDDGRGDFGDRSLRLPHSHRFPWATF